MISATIAWRQEFKPEAIAARDVLMMGCTGKIYVQGQDRQGRPIIVMRPGARAVLKAPTAAANCRCQLPPPTAAAKCCPLCAHIASSGYENSPGHPDNFKNLAYTLERACAIGGASKFAILLDFDKYNIAFAFGIIRHTFLAARSSHQHRPTPSSGTPTLSSLPWRSPKPP